MSDSFVADNSKLNVVICWHMHQPSYNDRLSGEYCLPWTYLHAIKDYVDMAAHLKGSRITDPLLSALGSAVLPSESIDRISIVQDCLRANKERLINRFKEFKIV